MRLMKIDYICWSPIQKSGHHMQIDALLWVVRLITYALGRMWTSEERGTRYPCGISFTFALGHPIYVPYFYGARNVYSPNFAYSSHINGFL